MNEGYEPSLDFTERVMERVHAFEARRPPFAGRIAFSRSFRYALACGWSFIGVFGAVPAF